MAVQPTDPYETPEEKQARLLREAQAKKGAAGNVAGGAASGALSGAMAGTALGPLGTAGGAIIGGLGGLIGGVNKQNAAVKQAGAPQPTMKPPPTVAPPGSIMDQTMQSTAPGQAMVGRVRPGQEQMVAPPQPQAAAGQQAPAPPPATPQRQPVNGLLASLGKIPGAIGSNIKQNPMAAVGLANDIGQTIGDFTKNKSEQRNDQEIADLKGREASGTMGLTGRERQNMSAAAMNPVRRDITALGNSLSGAQGTSPAQQASMRRDAGAAIAGADQAAAMQIEGADLDAARGNRAELEQRIATGAASSEQNRSNLGARLGGIVESEGMRAGGPPLDIMGPYGEPIRDEGQARQVLGQIGGIEPDDIEYLVQNPEAMRAVFDAIKPQSLGG